MTLRVLLFASYADTLGRDALDLVLPEGANVGDVVSRLGELPGGDRLPPRPLVAVNQVYAEYGQPLRAGDEVAVIPPVAGG
jgi:molybdopterin converting factor small subunit